VKIHKGGKTLQGRLTVAQAEAQSALDVFEVAAQRLDVAADQLAEVGNDAEVRRLEAQQVRDDAERQRVAVTAKAAKIRELFQ
jgi:hypothetical protein